MNMFNKLKLQCYYSSVAKCILVGIFDKSLFLRWLLEV